MQKAINIFLNNKNIKNITKKDVLKLKLIYENPILLTKPEQAGQVHAELHSADGREDGPSQEAHGDGQGAPVGVQPEQKETKRTAADAAAAGAHR